ncbi:DUF3168 domain-containing protein [Marivita hallyeonensis]|uniref:DUF3168 domain-containing protein n=1 Tax=Marivita hallyeonensis TaxID=996342 RepID=A0A1M5RNQ9_9RHOB|nr:DUF3168 domain-containing protein [Marivita hallyeonensis]SHH27862.1 Protein of unknown function [Marivita hallyeonensis]
MTYAVAAALQAGVFETLRDDAEVSSLVGDKIYDAVPKGQLPELYVALGPEKALDASDKTGRGAWHEFAVSVISDDAGFQGAKEVSAAVCDALIDAEIALARGRLVALNFKRAQAQREKAGRRRIDLIFRARVEDDA